MLTPRPLSFYGSYSFTRQILAEVLVASGTQTALMGLVILSRIFHPSDAAITTMFALNHATFLLAPLLGEFMRRHTSRPLFTTLLLTAPIVLMLAPFVEGFWGLAPLLVFTNLALVSMFVPLRNRIMRSNYNRSERGQCYATFTMASQGVYFGLVLAAALALRQNTSHIYWMLPVVGVLVALGLLIFRRIRVRGERMTVRLERGSPLSGPIKIYGSMFRLLFTERRFLLYELGFMIYGFGFMLTVPREIDAVANVLNLDYTWIVIGIYGISPLARVLCVRAFGRILDQKGPYHLAAAGYMLLAFYPLCLWGSVGLGSVALWYLARIFFGIAMGGVDIAWTIGPVTFGDRQRAALFSATHIFLVGFRASIGPFLGLIIAWFLGFHVFALGAVLFGLASLYMRWRGSRDTIHPSSPEFDPPEGS